MAMELNEMTDEQLSEHLNAVINEQERRANLARIPTQIAELAAKFVEGGGNPAELPSIQ